MSFPNRAAYEVHSPGGPQGGAYFAGSITFKTDGTMGFSTYISGPVNWYEPPQSGIGTSWWVRAHKTGGSRTILNDNVFVQITADTLYTPQGGAGDVTGTLDFSNNGLVGGIVASGSFSVNNTI